MASDDSEKTAWWKFKYFFKLYWKIIFTITWNLLLSSLFLGNNSLVSKCYYVFNLMAGYWVTQCLPLGMTSLLPLLLFPCLGILSIRDTGACYINDATMILIGGFILATAIEDSNLHMRIALKVIQVFSYNHYSLLSGVILVTYFLSMWITSTAATSMMVPIVLAVLGGLEREGIGRVFINTENLENPNGQPIPTDLTTTYLMGTAYAAMLGGSSTLVGSPSNLAFKGIFEKIFVCGPKIGFWQWMMFAVPFTLVIVVMTVIITFFFMSRQLNQHNSQSSQNTGIIGQNRNAMKKVMGEKYAELGKMTTDELGVAIMFVLFIILLVTREPGFMPGWASILPGEQIPESASILFVSLLMFLIPKDLDFLYVWTNDSNKRPKTSSEGLVTWKSIETRMPWSLLFLLGAGVALIYGAEVSGMSSILEKNFKDSLDGQEPDNILSAMLIFVGIVTNITPDVVTANIMLLYISCMSTSANLNPLYMVPGALMCSYSFVSSFGSPSIAIIRSACHVRVKSVILRGLGPAILIYFLLPIFYTNFGAKYVYLDGTQSVDWSNKTLITENELITNTCDQSIVPP
ncbi:protein I'm not dead yet-like [Copidosoma floridanum]|uniref:protein I'm not dead yet-like n=1 Tax=Copidosoma floridanum TaxID=29053 RepID=UPI0006C93C9E|nr:protein I'm not dead yet-like [Copidosoma floridanum]